MIPTSFDRHPLNDNTNNEYVSVKLKTAEVYGISQSDHDANMNNNNSDPDYDNYRQYIANNCNSSVNEAFEHDPIGLQNCLNFIDHEDHPRVSHLIYEMKKVSRDGDHIFCFQVYPPATTESTRDQTDCITFQQFQTELRSKCPSNLANLTMHFCDFLPIACGDGNLSYIKDRCDNDVARSSLSKNHASRLYALCLNYNKTRNTFNNVNAKYITVVFAGGKVNEGEIDYLIKQKTVVVLCELNVFSTPISLSIVKNPLNDEDEGILVFFVGGPHASAHLYQHSDIMAEHENACNALIVATLVSKVLSVSASFSLSY